MRGLRLRLPLRLALRLRMLLICACWLLLCAAAAAPGCAAVAELMVKLVPSASSDPMEASDGHAAPARASRITQKQGNACVGVMRVQR